MTIETYIPQLKNLLTESRFIHSVGVMQTMAELADIYSLDRIKAETIGLLHDAAKNLSNEQISLFVEECHIQIQYECESDYSNYLHGPVGAYLVRKDFGISDQEIIDAIYVHTFCDCGRNFNNPLSWCMRISDLIEPNRDWSNLDWMEQSVKELCKIAFLGKMKEASLLQATIAKKLLKGNGVPVHPNITRSIDELSSD